MRGRTRNRFAGCFACKEPVDETYEVLVDCSRSGCGHRYHAACVGRPDGLPAGASWHCGAHPSPCVCLRCAKSAAALSGRHQCCECLRPSEWTCRSCPAAYCNRHLPQASGKAPGQQCSVCTFLVERSAHNAFSGWGCGPNNAADAGKSSTRTTRGGCSHSWLLSLILPYWLRLEKLRYPWLSLVRARSASCRFPRGVMKHAGRATVPTQNTLATQSNRRWFGTHHRGSTGAGAPALYVLTRVVAFSRDTAV
jgi:hypothetical protein